jgi:integrase
LLLARLGLRAHEIIALQLQDCDWVHGHLLIRGTGRRGCVLPLPVDVGEAIAAYLEHGRATCEDRHLFLRSIAPIRGFMHGSDAIGSIVRFALQRAKVDALRGGSHQFRHNSGSRTRNNPGTGVMPVIPGPELQAPLRGLDARALVPVRRGACAQAVGAVDLPRSRVRGRYLLVLECLARVDDASGGSP